MEREKPKWKPHEGESTDAEHGGGAARSSVEVSVMGTERRGCIVRLYAKGQPAMGGIFWIKQSHLPFPSVRCGRLTNGLSPTVELLGWIGNRSMSLKGI